MRRTATTVTLALMLLAGMSLPARATTPVVPDYADVLAAVQDRTVPPATRIDPWATPDEGGVPRPVDGWGRAHVVSAGKLAALRLDRIRVEIRRERQAALAAAPERFVSSSPVIPVGAIQTLICSYSWDCSTALRVAGCESGFSTTAVNGSHFGLFQREGETSTDAETQVRNAFAMYSERGWQPWGLGESWGCAF